MRKYHGDALKALGDELTLHYHTFLWSDYNGDGTYYWNQSKTFNECRGDFDKAIAQSLIEEEVFTVTFRSGWHFMDNEWQAYADRLWPYNMDNNSPVKSFTPNEPYLNVIDWSQAPTNFVPFHPSRANYQVAGDGTGWNVRSVKMPSVTQPLVDSIFVAAQGGADQVVSLWAHLPEFDFLSQIARMDALIHTAASNFPAVKFRYCTAVEAMQRWRQTHDTEPPKLEVADANLRGWPALRITTDEPIYQSEPFVAFKDVSENYRILRCSPSGTNSWLVRLPEPRSSWAKVGVAVTDPAGNLTTHIVRYVPDDVFVDNLDPGYMELSGVWTNAYRLAWGTNARVALFQSKETASAQWNLPVTEARKYAVSFQVPSATNINASVFYSIVSGTNALATTHVWGYIPANRWLPVGTVTLNPAKSNVLTLSATGWPDTQSVALADVVKVSPLVLRRDFVRVVTNEVDVTTANLVWSSLSPSTGWVDYGEDIRYGRQTSREALLATNHVATLSGLLPGTRYQYQITAQADGDGYTVQGEFLTSQLDAGAQAPTLKILRSGDAVTLYWNGEGFELQWADGARIDGSGWNSIEPKNQTSPWQVPADRSGLYRLRGSE
jgi:hypothetical protein